MASSTPTTQRKNTLAWSALSPPQTIISSRRRITHSANKSLLDPMARTSIQAFATRTQRCFLDWQLVAAPGKGTCAATAPAERSRAQDKPQPAAARASDGTHTSSTQTQYNANTHDTPLPQLRPDNPCASRAAGARTSASCRCCCAAARIARATCRSSRTAHELMPLLQRLTSAAAAARPPAAALPGTWRSGSPAQRPRP